MFGLRWNSHAHCLYYIKPYAEFLNLLPPPPPGPHFCVQFLDFTISIDPELQLYDPDAAWPSVMDDFVEHERAKRLASDGNCNDERSAHAMEE
jgi:Cullin binding